MSGIEYTDASWNPIRGCSPVSRGCERCWAQRMANRQRGGAYKGFVEKGRWTGRVELIPDQLEKPLHWRKPRRIAVALMGDLFHEVLPDEDISRVFGIMAACPQHAFQVLTKRPQRMCDALSDDKAGALTCARYFRPWPLPNVWLGVSVEDQATADERIPLLLQTPAAVRWVSYEPALGPVDFERALQGWDSEAVHVCGGDEERCWRWCPEEEQYQTPKIDWLVIGGESGPGARPCEVEWIRSVVQQCREAGVPAFVKQLGRRPFSMKWVAGGEPLLCTPNGLWTTTPITLPNPERWRLTFKHPKGGDPAEWPPDLRVREFPQERAPARAEAGGESEESA